MASAALAAAARAVCSAVLLALASAWTAIASACCVTVAVCTWACRPTGMSWRREASAAGVGVPPLWLLLAEAAPATLPTAVTAVAETTASPRTDIRLTRFPPLRPGHPGGVTVESISLAG
ncbi:hypothetical protein ABZ646_28780 [Streptomyces sp. NPDC007162]|uniref:hypothetical protein n=1 Tax=Streptomyces sp. NPDC007162 TaxID=3156917 RepID=UPI0033FB2964